MYVCLCRGSHVLVSQCVSSLCVSIRLRVYECVCVCVCVLVCWCVRDGGDEQVDRELDHDDRDHGVRELDALRLQDGYLLCVMDCFVVVVGLAIARWAGFCGPVPDELMIGDSAIPLPESRSSGRDSGTCHDGG